MTSETGFLRRFIVTPRKTCRNRVSSYLCVGYETFRSNGKNHYKTSIKNGLPRYSQQHRKLPTKVRCTPGGNYRQRLGSAENSTCWIGRSIAVSVASSPKMGWRGNCTGDLLPISGINGSIFRRFVFSANSAPQRNFNACQQRQ